jgi:hypothetical protein
LLGVFQALVSVLAGAVAVVKDSEEGFASDAFSEDELALGLSEGPLEFRRA